jgi:signal transduction histidine kinase
MPAFMASDVATVDPRWEADVGASRASSGNLRPLDPATIADSRRDGQTARDLLAERLRFERLFVELSAAFNLPLHEIDEQIELGLRRLGEFLGIDRSSFAEFSEKKQAMAVTHCYVAAEVMPYPRVFIEEHLPWCADLIGRGEVIRLARLPDDLPSDATQEREYCQRAGLKSNLAIPLKVSESLRCVITFATFRDYREWPDDLVDRLRLIGEIFANSLARKRSEVQMQQLRDQLSRMSRVTLLGELAASIAHEINQPLCAIVSNAQAGQRMLNGTEPDLVELRETLADIAADSRRANQVVTRIREMLQSRTPEQTPLRLKNAILEVVELLHGQLISRRVSITLDIAADLPLVKGDRVQLQQVILNLLLNAIDAMSHPETERRELTIQARRDGSSRLLLVVRDSGPGIEPEHRDKLFDPFFTTKPNGIGVGLAICRSIIESHGGRIWENSDPGEGAEFSINLPGLKESLA